MAWIQTFTGLRFELDAPTMDMICIDDIAHSLSMQCRFAGHTPRHYSIAEHSIHCMNMAIKEYPKDTSLHLACLMHDAAEAYVLDVPKPMKPLLKEYDKLEENIMNLIIQKYCLDFSNKRKIKEYDINALVTEKFEFFNNGTLALHWDTVIGGIVNVEMAKQMNVYEKLDSYHKDIKVEFLKKFVDVFYFNQ